jgi:DnaJ-class molecular chaperone
VDIQQEIFELRVRIATLDGQMAGAQAELAKLRSIPCPACQGTGSVIDESHIPETSSDVWTKTCVICNGNGLACGERKY